MNDLTSRLVEVNGITLNVTMAGEGPLVVFCHGFPGHWSNWRHQLHAISAAGFSCLAVDMRGYGKSSRLSRVADYNMDEQVADMCGLLDVLNVKNAIFVGQDFGAALVWNMALREPARVSAVVGISVPFDHDYYGRSCLGHLSKDSLAKESTDGLLVASPINPPSHGFNAIAEHHFLHAHYFQQEAVPDKELGSNAREFLKRIYWGLSAQGNLGEWVNHPAPGTKYLDVLPEAPPLPWSWMSEQDMDSIVAGFLEVGVEQAFFGGLASYRVADINWHIGEKYAAQNVEVPALFIAGEADPVIASVNDATLERMKQRVPDLRGIKFISGAGHFVQFEKPNETNAEIIKFIKGLA
ncbi:MAG TPA: alpha/beta hydrolase [Gammaproteobacteria bacterium]|nr:alpha/beta hydrolase [Gammaproteobacteria bacterium]